jgi:branched-chain amino acid transport system ATP-binding protein
MLELRAINVFYGNAQALRDFSLALSPGEVLCLLGRNGAGKTTALRAIMGHVRVRSGAILMDGVDLSLLPPHEVPRYGIGYVPQGRRLFSELTVAENLTIGLMARRRPEAACDRALAMFPILAERLRQRAGSLSGGEQQMLAMARALCLEPKALLLDEPTEGLMPAMIARVREAISTLRSQGVGTILVEQRVDAVLPVADRVAFISNGELRDTVPVAAVRDDLTLVHRYVGVG